MQRLPVPHRRHGLIAFAVAVATCALAIAALHLGSSTRAPRFSVDVQPIFDGKCISCHPVAYPYLDLRRSHAYSELVRVAATTRPSFERVVPGKPEFSYLLTHPPDPSLRGVLTAGDKATIARWITAGAKDD